MKGIALVAAALFGLAAATPALAGTDFVTTMSPPAPYAASTMPQPANSVPAGVATSRPKDLPGAGRVTWHEGYYGSGFGAASNHRGVIARNSGANGTR